MKTSGILKKKYAGLPLFTWLGLALAFVVAIAGIVDRNVVELTNRQFLESLIKSNTIENTASAIVVTKRKHLSKEDRKEIDWVEMAKHMRQCMVDEAKNYLASDDSYLDRFVDNNTRRLLAEKLITNCDVKD